MAAPVRERPNEAVRAGRVDPLLLRSVGWSIGAHVLVVVAGLLFVLYAPEPTRFEPPPGPVVDLVSPRGDSKVFKVGPLATPSSKGRPTTSTKPPAPPKPEPPKAEPPAPEPAPEPKPEPKVEPPKPEPVKPPEPPKPEPPKVEPKPDALPPPKPEPKPEPKKPEPKKEEPKKPEPKKEEPKKPEPKKEEPKKPDPKKPEPKKEEPKKTDAKKAEPDKKADAKKTDAKPADKTAPPDAKPGPDQKGEPEKPGSAANTSGAGAPGAGKQTEGGQSGDPNGGGGGAGNRSPEFYAYFAYMYESIKAQWVWAGEADSTLAATVQFSILPDGTIADVRITERSRSAVYDDSALNAVRATGSLTPPPASVRADFEDVEFVFRAGDLMQP